MNCKEVEKMIPLFIEDKLDTEDLRDFLEHIHNCKECEEELSIQFLVSEGLSRLETGNVFDLQSELRIQMDDAHSSLKFRENMQWLLYGLEGIVVILIITLLLLLFVW